MFQKYPLFGTHKELTGSTVNDLGRMQFTKNEADKYMFKVPTLRNIAETWPYLHDGSVKELDKVVQLMAKAQLNKELTPEQTSDITNFRFPDIAGKLTDTKNVAINILYGFRSFYIKPYCSFRSEPGNTVSVSLRYSHSLVSTTSSRAVAWW